MRIGTLMLACALFVGACKKNNDAKEGSGTTGSNPPGSNGSAMAGSGSASGSAGSDTGMAGSGSAAGSGSGMAAGNTGSAGSGAGSNDAPAMAHHAGMCPSTVLNAATKADLSKDKKSVVVTITSDDKEAVKAIQKRTDELLAEKKDNLAAGSTSSAHDMKGTHGGGMGLCPVHAPEESKVASKKIAKGVEVTITPKDKPDELKSDVDARIQKAADWVKTNIKPGDKGNMGGTGGGSGQDGMNHSGQGDGKGHERKSGSGGGAGTGGGGGKGTGGGSGSGKK